MTKAYLLGFFGCWAWAHICGCSDDAESAAVETPASPPGAVPAAGGSPANTEQTPAPAPPTMPGPQPIDEPSPGAAGAPVAGPDDAMGGQAQGGAAGGPSDEPVTQPVPLPDPSSVLFIGSSFMSQGPVYDLYQQLAEDANREPVSVRFEGFNGAPLNQLLEDSGVQDAIAAGGWDVVLVQEVSGRATDRLGDPEAFKADATTMYDSIKEFSPDARMLFYQAWARHPDHSIYDNDFASPDELLTAYSSHYEDAVDNYIPMNAATEVRPRVDLDMAPIGYVWAAHLAEDQPLRLHGNDDYHAGDLGQYLNALVVYATIYESPVSGLVPLKGASSAEATRLQLTVDGYFTP